MYPANFFPPKPFYISPSALGHYFTCPAKYAYSRQWRAARVDQALTDGVDAHAIVAGIKTPTASMAALAFVARIRRTLKTEYQSVSRQKEIRDELRLAGGVVLVRIIDRLGVNRAGDPRVIDYKTGTWPWKTYPHNTVPKARGFQATAYTLPPSKRLAGIRPEAWPQAVDFLTVPSQGGTTIHTYVQTGEDVTNLLEAIEIVRSADKFPKVRGIACDYCPFRSKCFGYEKPGEYLARDDYAEASQESSAAD